MDKNEPDLVEQLHREAVQRRREQEVKEHALVEAMFREARERQRKEEEQGNALVDSVHRAAVEAARGNPPPTMEPPTIHYSELPEARPDSPLYTEWEFYRQAAAKLLAAGNEGRHVLIKGARIIGIWDTHDEAASIGYQQFPGQPFLVHQIQERERLLRCVTIRRCHNGG